MNKNLIISGRVQGVGFRHSAQLKAKAYRLSGWVQNKTDGTVELEVEGEASLIATYIKELKAGLNPFIRVDHIKEKVSQEEKGYSYFTIR